MTEHYNFIVPALMVFVEIAAGFYFVIVYIQPRMRWLGLVAVIGFAVTGPFVGYYHKGPLANAWGLVAGACSLTLGILLWRFRNLGK